MRMKRLIAAALAISMLGVAGCGKPSSTQNQTQQAPVAQSAQTEPQQASPIADAVTVDDVLQRLKAGEKLTIVDVRTEEEFAQGHVPGSELVPLQTLQQGIAKFPKEQELYLICRSGNRSGQAQAILREMGYTKTHNVTGGIQAWEKAGGEIEK